MRRCWSPSWTNSDSEHTHYWPSIQSNASWNGPKWFLVPKNLGFDTKIKSVACPEVELLHHEEVHHLFREVDHVVDTHGNVVVRTKRDHFSKYAPKRSNHANFQLIKIKNKKVMTKKPLIVENTNPLWKFVTVMHCWTSFNQLAHQKTNLRPGFVYFYFFINNDRFRHNSMAIFKFLNS